LLVDQPRDIINIDDGGRDSLRNVGAQHSSQMAGHSRRLHGSQSLWKLQILHWVNLLTTYGGLIFILRKLPVRSQQFSSIWRFVTILAHCSFSFQLSRELEALRGVKVDFPVMEYQRSYMTWEQHYCNVVWWLVLKISTPQTDSELLFHGPTLHTHPTITWRRFYLLS
jgi:hypothetical protein